MQIPLPSIPTWAKQGLKFLWYVTLLAVGGIIGNRADSGFLLLLPHISEPVTINKGIIFSVTSALCLIVALPFSLILVPLAKAHKLSTQLNNLDGTIFLLLSRLPSISNPSNTTSILINEFLDSTLELIELFINAPGLSICLPDLSDPEYLVICHSMPPVADEVVRTLRFYTGSANNRKRGIAGCSFITNQLQVAKLSKQTNGQWVADHEHYLNTGASRYQLFKSSIALPIPGPSTTPLGIMCVDSCNPDAFDSKEVQNLLAEVARRFAVVILVREFQQP